MPTPSPRLSHLNRVLGIALLNLALVAPALGQSTSIPLSTVESASVGGSQQSQIAEFVEHWSQRATSTDPQQAWRARTKLMEPLVNRRVSISFRQSYSDALGPFLDELAENNDIGSTLTSLRLAGELGTSRGVKIILAGLMSDDLSVQIFAAGRAGRTFRMTAANGLAMSASELHSLINHIGVLAESSNDESVLSACIQSLGFGTTLPSRDFLQDRASCLSIMCNAANTQLTDPSNGWDLQTRVRLAIQASGSATHSLLQNGEKSTHDAVKASVALGSEMIAHVLMQVINNTMPDVGNRDLQIAMVRSGESLLHFALREHAELNNQAASSVKLTQFAELLEAGKDRDFRNQAALLLGDGSQIITDFNFAGDEFIN